MKKPLFYFFICLAIACGDDLSKDKGKKSPDGTPGGSVSSGPGTGSTSPAPTNACLDYEKCLLACPEGDTTCGDVCRLEVGSDVAFKYEDLFLCAGACNDESDCVFANCVPELRACGFNTEPPTDTPTTGTSPSGCAVGLDCVVYCEGEGCAEECAKKMDAEAFALFEVVVTCYGNCEVDDCTALCKAEFNACMAD